MASTLSGSPYAPAPLSALPTADIAVTHTLLNCLLREVSAPERQTAVVGDRLLLRLPRRGVLLRVALRRGSLLGSPRFTGPVTEQRVDGDGDDWTEIDWSRLAAHVRDELSLRTGVDNDEFLDQVAASHRGAAAALALTGPDSGPVAGGGPRRGPDDRLAAYLTSEQSLVLGHRFHPTPKAHSGDPVRWAAYAPEAGASFPLRMLAVREELVAQECADPDAAEPLDRLHPVPDGYRLLPAHPWQYELLGAHPGLRAALDRRDVLDLGPGRTPVTPTASVRTVHTGTLRTGTVRTGTALTSDAFLKFSLNVRITNCLRKNASYELSGAVALTRLLAPAFAELAVRFPGTAVLREPAYRSLAVAGPDERPDPALLEGFGVIVRDGLARHLRPGTTPLLAAAVADEYATGPAHVSRLLAGAGPEDALRWWTRYLRLLVPPVLAAYFDHGIVLEPHLQNVLLCVDDDGRPAQVLFRDLEGTKLLPGPHTEALRSLPPEVAGPLTYDARRGWDRVVYCLVVNHAAELLAALADLHPSLERALWERLRGTLQEYAHEHGCPPRLRTLLAGVPLPAKANLLARWERSADRDAEYVRLPSPLADSDADSGTSADAEWSTR
ncbi:IucA/IucC family protein [Streptomyces sp. NPDC058001]|uniref:IucA/IucC family protein n=1 Tax=Streptomyces sp. NPDC058001 TaxID=3346300 RepID=UPI0036EACA47